MVWKSRGQVYSVRFAIPTSHKVFVLLLFYSLRDTHQPQSLRFILLSISLRGGQASVFFCVRLESERGQHAFYSILKNFRSSQFQNWMFRLKDLQQTFFRFFKRSINNPRRRPDYLWPVDTVSELKNVKDGSGVQREPEHKQFSFEKLRPEIRPGKVTLEPWVFSRLAQTFVFFLHFKAFQVSAPF